MVVKILFTVSYYLPYISGLTIYAASLAEELAKKKHQVFVLTAQSDKKFQLKEQINSVRVNRIPALFKVSKGFMMPSHPLHAWRSISSAEIVVVHLPQLEGVVVAILTKVLNKRLITIYHCDINLPEGFTNKIIERLLYLANFTILHLSDKVISQTKDYAKHSRVLTKFKHKLICIYPPIPIPIVDPVLQSKLESKFVKKTKYKIGFIGRLATEKGVEYLLETIPILKQKLGENFLIILAGPANPVGEEKYKVKINHLTEKYQSHIHFIDEMPIGLTGSFYSLLDVLVLPSVNSTEAFGMVQVEAMICGVPVVASDLPGVRVPIQKTGMGILVKPKNTLTLASEIVKIIRNKDKYIKSKSQILKIFNLNTVIQNYHNLFTDL